MSSVCFYCDRPMTRHYHAVACWDCMRKRQAYMDRAHKLVSVAVLIGRLPSKLGKLCVDCGAPAHAYDHRDYARPLDVEPVCRACNHRRGPATFPMAVAA